MALTPVADPSALQEADFRSIASAVQDYSGIQIPPSKRSLVESRLRHRLQDLGIEMAEYGGYLSAARADELPKLVNALTTNLTSFFRESHHFGDLVNDVVPEFRALGAEKLLVWSAGCSLGHEPYSIAMTLLGCMSPDSFQVIASDIDSEVLASASEGIYSDSAVADLPATALAWFQRGKNAQQGRVRVRPDVRDQIDFRHVNLISDWSFDRPFNAIFCRNVVIYFDRKTKSDLVDRFADVLVDGGHLFMGHSESLLNTTSRFELLGKTHYRKVR